MSGTDEICTDPYAYGQTHHLVPRRVGNYTPTRGEPKEPRFVQTCQYCGATKRNGVMVPAVVSYRRVR